LALVGVGGPAVAGRTIRLGTVVPEGSRFYEDLSAMADEVERLSEGELKIQWIWGGALGDDAAMAALIKAGKLDGGGLTDVGVTYLVKEMVLWGYPGLFEDYAEVDYIEKQFHKRFENLFDAAGLQLLLLGDIGFLHVFSDAPIGGLDDLRKKKLWLWSDDTATLYSSKLFAIQSVDSSLGELRGRLKDGTYDTFQYPPLAAIAWELHPYAKYISELRIRLMMGAIVVRKDLFEELPPDQQRLLSSIGKKWERRIVKSWRSESQKAVEVMLKGGMKLAKVSEKARQQFFQLALQKQPEFAKQLEVTDLMGEVVDALRKFREARSTR